MQQQQQNQYNQTANFENRYLMAGDDQASVNDVSQSQNQQNSELMDEFLQEETTMTKDGL